MIGHAKLESRAPKRSLVCAGLAVFALLALATPTRRVSAEEPAVGAWATYRWTSTLGQEVTVLVKDEAPGGQVSWSIARETAPPPPLFVTYSIVRGDARTYTLQIVTHQTLGGPPLSVTQITISRSSGEALRSVIREPKGLIATIESGLRPFAQAAVEGTEESVLVPWGRFGAVRASYRNGTVWVSDQIPPLGLVKATFPNGTLEVVRSSSTGAKDLLRS